MLAIFQHQKLHGEYFIIVYIMKNLMLYNYVFIFQVNIELFRDDERLEDVIERSNIEKSTFTIWFHANTIQYIQMQGTQHMQIFQFDGFIIIKPNLETKTTRRFYWSYVFCLSYSR